MKGKKAPLVVYEIGAEIGTRRREGLEVEEFIGREKERAGLTKHLADLRQGRGGVVQITGDTGMGKSKLVREAECSWPPEWTWRCTDEARTTAAAASRLALSSALSASVAFSAPRTAPPAQ